jgi:hypothetical protein
LMVGVVRPVASRSVATVVTGFACSTSWIMSSEPAIRGMARSPARSSRNACVTRRPVSMATSRPKTVPT